MHGALVNRATATKNTPLVHLLATGLIFSFLRAYVEIPLVLQAAKYGRACAGPDEGRV